MAILLRQSRLANVQASCIAYDASTGHVILPGRRAFAFCPLNEHDFPSYPKLYTWRQTAVVDATRISCNPEYPSQFAIARGQNLELHEFIQPIVTTEICSKRIELQAHTKVVDDFSWCPTVSNWLVSCSRDQYAILWDIPCGERVANFRATSPFTCCCWLNSGKTFSSSSPTPSENSSAVNSPQMSGYVVVATADSRLLFWDVRVGNRPAIVVQAHTLRIHAMDAGSTGSEQYQLVTAADGDSRMALWDVRNLDRKVTSIESPFGSQAPRKMRFSPGGGMLLVTASTMPRPTVVDEPRAAVVSLTDSSYRIMLNGHIDHVYDAIWKSEDTILTWSQDFNLRVFQVTVKHLTPVSTDSSTKLGISSSTSDAQSRDSTPSTPPTLRPVATDPQQIAALAGGLDPTLSSTPAQMPMVSPQSIIPQPPPLPTQMVQSTNMTGPGTPAIQFSYPPTDYLIPSPRTAGARFSPAGFLVSLHRLYELKQQTGNRALADFHKAITGHPPGGGRPRSHRNRHTSLSRQSDGTGASFVTQSTSGFPGALTAGVLPSALSPSSGGIVTQSSSSGGGGLTSASSGATLGATSSENSRQHTVLIYSVNALLKCNRELAVECRLDWVKPAVCCRENAEIAMSFNRPDLAQAFSVAALVLDDAHTSPTRADLVACIGRDALIQMFSHYLLQGCLQDAAMLAFFLSHTGIDLNHTPVDTAANSPKDHDTHQESRTPPANQSQNSSFAASASGGNDYQSAEDFILCDRSYDHSLTVGPNFWRKIPVIQVSTVKRSSSWHDVQNMSPPDGTDGSLDGGSHSHNVTPSSRQLHPSPQKKSYYNQLIEMTVSKRLQPDDDSQRQLATTEYAGYSEAERMQMATVLRCYANQLQAWRLHIKRTALVRPLDAISAGQLLPADQCTNHSLLTEATATLRSIPHITQSTGALGRAVGFGSSLNRQASFDVMSIGTPLGSAARRSSVAQSSSASACTANCCSVCERPVRGLSAICLLCGHGGHALHIRDFFSSNSSNLSCPAGCGCRCPSFRVPVEV